VSLFPDREFAASRGIRQQAQIAPKIASNRPFRT
jgi:hypothetical protein